ncbi:hypothetical protein EYF80_045975 [Liparis tanakae]|uniref:Uncharacterized protein n=1 Tax=Liparis tanakae TaxID=230148 RepID=A0A4Z2FT05_9TELE|nr:hypothetical protein EYF80_045975 [Liparis tanakae]
MTGRGVGPLISPEAPPPSLPHILHMRGQEVEPDHLYHPQTGMFGFEMGNDCGLNGSHAFRVKPSSLFSLRFCRRHHNATTKCSGWVLQRQIKRQTVCSDHS